MLQSTGGGADHVEEAERRRAPAESTASHQVRRTEAGNCPPPLVTQPRTLPDGGGYELLDAHAFRNAVCAYLADATKQEFTLVVLQADSPARTLRLGKVVLETVRAASGDLAGTLEGALAVFLRASRRPEATPFVERLNVAWRRTGGEKLAIAMADHPAEEHRVIDLLSADWLRDNATAYSDRLQ